MNLFARIPTLAYLAIFVALAFGQVWLLRDTVMGDAFIHFVFARGIVEGTPFFYNGVFSAGSTSPLWSAMLAPIWAVCGDCVVDGVKIFASFFVGLAVVLGYIVSRQLASRGVALGVSFFMATSFVLPFWAAKGMETPMWVCLVLSSFLLYFQLLKKDSRSLELALGVVLGLGIFARPEGWFLAAFIGLPLLITKGWRVLLTIGLPGLIIALPYYIYLFSQTGQIFPSSAARVLHAQQWLEPIGGFLVSTEIFKILATKLAPLSAFFLWFGWQFFQDKRTERRSSLPTAIQNWFILGPILAWLVFHLVFFSTVMPMTQGYRYLLAALPFFYLISLLGLWRFRARGFFPHIAFIVFALSASFSLQQLIERQETIASCEMPFIDSVRHETGLWLRDNTESDDLIAIKEVDQSAYYSGRQVLSMDGTLNLAAVPFVKEHDQLGYLTEFRPDWLVLEEEMYNYPGWRDSNLHPLIDPTLQLGESKELGGMGFQLADKMNVGTQNDCGHFVGDKSSDEPYFWYFYKIDY